MTRLSDRQPSQCREGRHAERTFSLNPRRIHASEEARNSGRSAGVQMALRLQNVTGEDRGNPVAGTRRKTMKNLFEMIYEYQHLRGKQDHLDVPLEDGERARLVGLEQLLSGEAVGDARRSMPRLPVPTRVLFTLPGGFETGEIKNVSGTGLAIATRRPPEIGTRIVVRVEEGTSGVEYFFPCRVVWRRMAANVGMGVAFDGVPGRSLSFGDDESSGVWTRQLRLGDRQKDIAAA